MSTINCTACGRPMSYSDRFCNSCGHASPTESPRPVGAIHQRYKALVVVSIILKIIAWAGVVALLLASIAASQVSRVPLGAYLVLGLLGSVLWWLWHYAVAELIVLLIDLESHARSVRLMMEQGRITAQPATPQSNV